MRILKIETLPNATEWVDRDEIMLHACFQLLRDCVDREAVDTHCNYEAHKEFVDEVRFLYAWWNKRESRNTDNIDNMEEDDIMLSRLLKIRTQLWT